MKNKLICILISMLLFATVFSVAGTTTTETKEVQTCGLAPGLTQKIPSTDTMRVPVSKGDTFYAYCAYDPSAVIPEGPICFESDNPGEINSIAPTVSADFIAGGCWANGVWYGSEYGTSSQIWTIDENTGTMTAIGFAGIDIHGMAYDPSTGILYGSSPTALYTINMATGAGTLIGTFNIGGELVIAIACDEVGNMYAHDIVTDAIYTVNTATGQATLIGPTGLSCNYAQDMAYDMENGILYLSAYTSQGELYTCNVATGACTFIGAFEGGIEVTALAIPAGASGPVLEIADIKGGIGVSAVIENVGESEATDVEWMIELDGVFPGLGGETTGNIEVIPAGEAASINTGLVFGLGPTAIKITAQSAEGASAEGESSGFVILIFVIGVS